MQRLRDRVEDYLDHRAPVWALVLAGVVLMAVAVVLLLLMPHAGLLELVVIFAIAVTGSLFLRTGLRVNRERREAIFADTPEGDGEDDDPLA